MDKLKIKQGFLFVIEISLFMFTGYFLAIRDWVAAGFTFVMAMLFAVMTGELIKQDAVREYKKQKKLK